MRLEKLIPCEFGYMATFDSGDEIFVAEAEICVYQRFRRRVFRETRQQFQYPAAGRRGFRATKAWVNLIRGALRRGGASEPGEDKRPPAGKNPWKISRN